MKNKNYKGRKDIMKYYIMFLVLYCFCCIGYQTIKYNAGEPVRRISNVKRI